MAPRTQTIDRPDMARPQDHAGFQELRDAPNVGALITQPGETAMTMMGQVIVAQKIVVARDIELVKKRIRDSAAFAGDKYIYSWPVKNKRRNTEEIIEGPTVKLANDIARAWGNCGVDVRVFDFGEFWIFYARFSDYETGYQLTRAFQQRKAQEMGMADKDRALDIVFQIGQSKALRNVVVNALSDVTEFAMDLARSSLVEKFGNQQNADRAWAYIEKIQKEEDIADERIERVFGKPMGNFSIRELALLYTQMRGIDDGLSNALDLFPEKGPDGAAKPETTAVATTGQSPNSPAGRPAQQQEPGDSSAGTAPQADAGASKPTETASPATVAATTAGDGAPAAAVPPKRGRGRPAKNAAATENGGQGAPPQGDLMPQGAGRPAPGQPPAVQSAGPASAPAQATLKPADPMAGDPFAIAE